MSEQSLTAEDLRWVVCPVCRQRLQPDTRDLYSDAHGQVDRFLLTRVLEYTGGSQHKAARLLGIARQTLRLKLRDLRPTASRPGDAERKRG